MKVIATADLHGFFPEIEPCDLLLIAGDVCPIESDNFALKAHERDAQAEWILTEFADWCAEQPAKDIVWIAGNHDFGPELKNFAQDVRKKFPKNCHYLNCTPVEVQEKVIYGIPWTPNLANWAFYASPRAWDFLAEDIPTDTDILLIHPPPRGALLDDTHPSWAAPYIFDEIVNRVQPELVVCGHIHEGYGEFKFRETLFTNVALCNTDYKPVQLPKEYTL